MLPNHKILSFSIIFPIYIGKSQIYDWNWIVGIPYWYSFISLCLAKFCLLVIWCFSCPTGCFKERSYQQISTIGHLFACNEEEKGLLYVLVLFMVYFVTFHIYIILLLFRDFGTFHHKLKPEVFGDWRDIFVFFL